MKEVLLIDESNVFKDFISEKFESHNVGISICVGKLDGLSKMRSIIPDLAIIDYASAKDFLFDLLEEKGQDLNAKSIPVILMAHELEKKVLNRLASLGVRKVVPKPVKIDQLFSAVSSFIGIDFNIDMTPCILEARVNEGILFIEIAQGLNREKIGLLKFRIRELIELYDLAAPKVLIMLSDLSLSFADGTNLELLLDNVLSDHRIRARNTRVLTMDSFARDFISGNKEYQEIQVVDNLMNAVDSLVREPSNGDDKATVISERILSAGKDAPGITNFEMRFKSELETLKTTGKDIHIAVVDDDVVIRTILEKTFRAINAKVDLFESGVAFLTADNASRYDLIFLDLIMPELNGFQVLQKIREQKILSPIIVLSAVSKREAVLKALSSGVKSYLIKPLEPHMILKKAIEVLKASL